MEKVALVTGATGFVGTELCKELAEHDYTVRGLHRVSSDTSKLAQLGVALHRGDVTDRLSLESAMQGVSTVFHIAALFREAKHSDDVYYEVNVEGTRNVFEAAIAAGVRRVVHCSTVGVHSHIPVPPASEDEEFRPADIYQRTKCEGEQLVREYLDSHKIDGCIIRPAMIWGPGDRRTLKLFKGVQQRRMPVIGTGKTHLHWVMVDDLARGFRLAAESQASSGQTYILAGRRSVSMQEMFETIADVLGTTVLPIRVPAWPVQLAGSLCELCCVPLGIEPPLDRRRVDFFTKTRWFDCSKAEQELDYRARRDFAEEVREIADWYRLKGWL